MTFQAVVKRSTSIREAVRLMGSQPGNRFIAGIAVVIDEAGKVAGVVTDGDVRRGLSRDVSVDAPVEEIARFDPVTIDYRLSHKMMRQAVIEKARLRGTDYRKYDKLVLIDEAGRLKDVVRLADILTSLIEEKNVAVYGMGFVGLTLACTFANAGLSVVGVDTNETVLAKLKMNQPTFYEKGLESLLLSLADSNPLKLTSKAGEHAADIHVVSVGTPVGKDKLPDMGMIRTIAKTISGVLKRGDLVVLRSTVPVGTTRKEVLPVLESGGLVAGRDFFLAFAPERTAEGNALEELRVLPQIVGGFDSASVEMTARLFGEITNTIVEVGSLEAAEMVKLMNNTFRDLVFSFANEVAFLCDDFNADAFRLIQAANEGYPRNPIPLPSPGVGGLCLSKDSYLYSNPQAGIMHKPTLGKASRAINSQGATYVLAKLEKFAARHGLDSKNMKVLLVGLAFKGMPETSDYRDSVALELAQSLEKSNLTIKDFVVSEADIKALGYTAGGDLADAVSAADAILVMNNHYLNNKFNVVQALQGRKRPTLLFDGWHMFNRRELEGMGVTYATMGYMTLP
jgi:UDP-N-acetyl-D-mannosaminuronic acid dehydrogenase